MSSEPVIELVYDRQCPVCDFYCRRASIDAAHGRLVLVDARDPGAVMDEITARGLDIDEGMVLKIGDELYYGADAIHELARRSGRTGAINRLGRIAFRSRRLARAIYPLLKACRNLLLKLLGRTRINNLRLPGRERF
ncbi:MAG: DCC1-like thiol-disulfide oxidoreductase family protein [Woeseiaceae bacterium]|nr:DCC1-like thiol-disulfide oxidoreductase family protein [Woeseiaceae bacterium]